MTSHLMVGFADELVKTAAKTSLFTKALRLASKTKKGKSVATKEMVAKVKNALKDSEYRERIRHAAILGAGTNAAVNVAGGGDDPALKRALKGAIGGAVGGAITGATMPGWFAKSNRKP